jgi:hypothetical protein
MKNKLSDSRVLNGLFDLILNLPLGDRRTVGIREYEPLDVSNLGLLQICFFRPRFALQRKVKGGTCSQPLSCRGRSSTGGFPFSYLSGLR